MTQEQKAKAYDEAIERAKAMIKVAANQDETIGFANTIFPELKEWEDERAMKDLLNFLKSPFIKDNICDWKVAPWIAWIEKHGQVKESVIFQHENKTYNEHDDSLTSEDEKIRDEICIYIGAKQDISLDVHNRWLSWLERQGEKLPVGFYYVNSEGKKFYSDTFKYGDVTLRVEKQGEQKSTDKVEPKFKPGDWIVRKDGEPFFNGNHYAQITVIDKEQYWFDCGTWLEAEDIRLWTIQDAKDGDVLVHNSCTFIFMGIKNGVVKALEENFFDGTNPVSFGEPDKNNDYQPATKEQRELLFQKIKEAGYEWDTEKKELKCKETKVFDAPTPFEDKLYALVEACEFLAIPNKKIEFILEHSQEILDVAREQIGKEQKLTWSENEMKMLNNLITYLNGSKGLLEETKSIYIDWLKSLKEKINYGSN